MRARLALVVAALSLLAASSRAEASARVAVVQPREAAALDEVLARLAGELALHGFAMHVVVDAPPELERVVARAGAVAAISLAHDSTAVTARVWLAARGEERSITVQQGAEGPSLLAVQLVDLLRIAREEPPAAPPLASATPAPARDDGAPPAAAARRSRRVALEAGAATQLVRADFSPAFGPLLATGLDLGDRFGVRLVAQAPLRRARAARAEGTATLEQAQLLAELRVRAYRLSLLSLEVLLAAGVHHLRVRGHAREPYRDATDARWLAALGAGAGAAWHLLPWLALSLRGRLLALGPEPVIELGGQRLAQGRLLVQLAGGLDVWF
jgi:hypothetical protein